MSHSSDPEATSPSPPEQLLTLEQQRLQALEIYQLLDTPPEQAYDDLVQLAAHICSTPMAVFTLIDTKRQWFKAAVGMPVQETDRASSFCTHTIESDNPFVVVDALQDPHFASNPYVLGEPNIRFYAGIPLKSSLGPTLGSLAVIDRVPRELTACQLGMLQALARQAMAQLELRLERIQHLQRQRELHYAHETLRFHLYNSPLAAIEWDSQFRVAHWSPQAKALFGWREKEVLGLHPTEWRFVADEDVAAVDQIVDQLLSYETDNNVSLNRNYTRNGEIVYCEWYNSVLRDDQGQIVSILSLVHNVTPRIEAQQTTLAALARERIAHAEAEVAKNSFRSLFESAPGLYLVLDPEEYDIIAVSQAYLTATFTQREQLVGHRFFDVFPAPSARSEQPAESFTDSLRASLDRVKTTGKAEAMAVQQYPVTLPDGSGLEERFWSPLNSPVLGPNGAVTYIIHRVEDVTDYIHRKKSAGEDAKDWQTIDPRIFRMEADIVLRSQALQELNQQLRISEERFRRTFAAATVGIVSASLDGHLLSVNPAFCQMLGYSEAELLALDVYTVTHPDDREPNRVLVQELVEGQRDSFVIEKRYLKKQSGIQQDEAQHSGVVWSRISVSLQRDSCGQPVNLVAVTEDITQQRKVAEQLRQSQALSRIGGRLGRLGGWAVDVSPSEPNEESGHHKVFWSEEMFAILEWTRENTPTLEDSFNLYPPEHRDRISAALLACTQAGIPFDIELEVYTGTGRRIWARVVGEPERDAQGEIVRAIGAFQDITPLKQAESAVERFAARLRVTLESMTDAFYLLDGDWRFTYLNAEAERLLKRTAPEILGREVWEVFPELRQSVLYDEYQVAVETYQSRHFEFFFPPLEEWFEVNAYPSTEGLGVYFRAITHRMALEEQLRQAQRLEALGQLTGGVAHDFNNLLTVMMGNAELLTEMLDPDSGLRTLAEMITGAAHRGAELTQRLLAFARRQALDPKPVGVNQLLITMGRLLHGTLGEDIEMEIQSEAALWLALVDPAQLESAVLNLCLNARDAMPQGGRLVIDTSNVNLDLEYTRLQTDLLPGPYVSIAISDTGVGIEPEHLNRVFEPFFTTKPKGKGTGLGLSMVYGFVKQSNGHIRIYSELGQGTTVRLYLPRYTGDPVETQPPQLQEDPVGGDELVLLVEDDGLVRSYAQEQLERLGYRVISADNGRKALELIYQRPDIELLFTDVIMPGGMTGRELADAARQVRPDLKVLFTSGYSESAIIHHGRLDQGVQLLSKPYRRIDLARKIRHVLDQESQGC